MQLRLADIIKESVVDGPGLRTVIFVQGCPHNCPGCHNPDTHNPSGGYITDVAAVFSRIAEYVGRNKLIRGVTFSGGEPFCQSVALANLAFMIKTEIKAKLGFNIITYTGYTFEELLNLRKSHPGVRELLEYTDILVEGPFLEEKRNLLLTYRGSDNQRLIKVKPSLRIEQAVLWSEKEC